MSICCDCGKDKQAFLCLSCNDKWLEQAERRGRVKELEHIAKLLNSNYTGFEDWLRISKYVVKKLKMLGGKP